MDKVELLLKIVPMTNPIKFKKLGSIFLEAELLSAITLCCCLHPQSQHPSVSGPRLSFCNHITGKGKEKEIGQCLLFRSQISKETKKKIYRSKLSQNTKTSEEQYTVFMQLQCFLTHSQSVPGEQRDCRKQTKIALSYAT